MIKLLKKGKDGELLSKEATRREVPFVVTAEFRHNTVYIMGKKGLE